MTEYAECLLRPWRWPWRTPPRTWRTSRWRN